MKDLTEILAAGRPIEEIIKDLKDKTVNVPDWSKNRKNYFAKEHKILTDYLGRKDRILEDGTQEKAARIAIGIEELVVDRLTQFTFSIPVQRKYGNINDNKVRKDIANAIEQIYRHAHIDSENLKRGKAYYASSEICTVWYSVKKKNDLYGFPSEYKLKCKTYSPFEDEVKLYPLIDDNGEMWAMSFQYTKKDGDNTITYFETYTEDKHYLWRQSDNNVWVVDIDGEEIIINKIPSVYLWSKKTAYEKTSILREEIEYAVSRSSDTIAYNAAPIIKVVGNGVKGQEKKGESNRVWRVEKGGDVSYVSWAQSVEAYKFQVDVMKNWIFTLEQLPDISFDNMKSLGNIGYDARMLMFADAHLRVGNESGPILEFLERENNVVKAFLKQMNKSWEGEIDNVSIDNVITPYVPNDVSSKVSICLNGTGNKPMMTQLDAIKFLGLSKNPEETLEELKKEEEEAAKAAAELAEENARRMNNMFQ